MKKNRKKSIGIFDSGFGGLHIMRGIVKELPEYDFVYLGDTARTPYGTRSKDVVYDFTKQAVDFLFGSGCELVILACNTASSDALRKIQKQHLPKFHEGKKVLGVVIPAVEEASAKTKNKKIGVIATQGTVASGVFERELLKIDSEIEVFQKSCPLLVPIVEAGEHDSEVAGIVLEKYLGHFSGKKIDTLILGCTHYGILEKRIRKIVGKEVKMISEAGIVAKKLRNYLKSHPELESRLSKKGKNVFYSTDLTENFKILGSEFFGKNIKVKKASLG